MICITIFIPMFTVISGGKRWCWKPKNRAFLAIVLFIMFLVIAVVIFRAGWA